MAASTSAASVLSPVVAHRIVISVMPISVQIVLHLLHAQIKTDLAYKKATWQSRHHDHQIYHDTNRYSQAWNAICLSQS